MVLNIHSDIPYPDSFLILKWLEHSTKSVREIYDEIKVMQPSVRKYINAYITLGILEKEISSTLIKVKLTKKGESFVKALDNTFKIIDFDILKALKEKYKHEKFESAFVDIKKLEAEISKIPFENLDKPVKQEDEYIPKEELEDTKNIDAKTESTYVEGEFVEEDFIDIEPTEEDIFFEYIHSDAYIDIEDDEEEND